MNETLKDILNEQADSIHRLIHQLDESDRLGQARIKLHQDFGDALTRAIQEVALG